MECEVCGKKTGEYRCAVCGKIVCEEHHKTIDGKVYCINDLPKRPVSSSLKSLIYTVAILLAGILIVNYALIDVIGDMPLFSDVIPLTEGFSSFTTFIIIGLVIILAILIIAYAISSRKYK